jgi:putative flippase GtrA
MKLLVEFSKFVIVGIIRTIMGMVIVFIPYNVWGVNYILCNVVGYSVALVTGFIMHRKWAFESHNRWTKEIIPYLATFGLGFFVNMILLLIFAEKLGMNKNISLVIASCGFTLTNYFGNKLWTFRKIKAKTD